MARRSRGINVPIGADASRLRQELSEAENEIGGFGTRIKEKLGGIGTAVAAGAAGVAAAGIGAAIKGTMDALNREQIFDRTFAQIGASGSEAERLGAVAGDLYANAWGDSLEEVADATGTVFQQLGDEVGSRELLQGATQDALDLANVMDEDVNRVVQAAGQLLRNDLAGSAEEAFDLLAAGQTGGLNRTEDLLDTMNEYATAFSRLGLDGNQAMGLLNQGLEAGVFNTDKIGDAFNEFSIRAIDGSDATAEAFAALGLNAEEFAATIAEGGPAAAGATSEVISALRGMDDQIQQDAAGVALFGSMWEDLGADAITALDPMTAGLGDVSTASEDLSATLNDNLNTRIETLKRKGFQALADIAEKYLIPALEFVVAVVEDVSAAFDEGGLTGVLDMLSERFGWFAKGREIVETAFGAIMDVVAVLQEAWRIFGDEITAVVETAFNYVRETIENAIQVLQGIIDFVAGVFTGDWDRAWEGIRAIFGGVLDQFGNMVNAAKETIVAAFQAIWDAVQVLWDWSFLSGVVSGAWSAVTRITSEKMNTLVKWIGRLPGRISSAISTLANIITAPFRNAFEAVKRVWNSTVGGFGFSIPGWLGGGSFRIPKMAEGGIVTGPTLALIGERGPEAVIPLSRMGDTTGPTSVPYQIVLDGQILAEGIARANQRTGAAVL